MEIDLDSAVKGFSITEVMQKFSRTPSFMRNRKEQSVCIDNALSSLYQLVGASAEDHMVFTSSHAEAINHLLFATYLDVSRKTGKNHFVTSAIDEAPQIMGMSRLQELGALFDLAPVTSQGKVTLDTIRETITPRTVLLSISMANGLTGVLQPVEELATLCKERGIFFHVDVSHVVGKKPIAFQEGLFDFITFNGENIGAPPGTGVLFIRKDLQISPLIIGGSEQGSLRGGSYNLGLLEALSKAAEIAESERDAFSIESARLRAFFEMEIKRRFANDKTSDKAKDKSSSIANAKVLFSDVRRVPHITAIDFPHVTGDALLYYLHRKNVFATQGGGRMQKISHILKASEIDTLSALSFSFSRSTTEDELEKAAEIISEGVQFLQKTNMSCPI